MDTSTTPVDVHTADTRQEKSSIWLYIAIVALLLPMAVAIVWAMNSGKSSTMATVKGSCRLQQGPCQALFPNGAQVSLSISPSPIRERKQLHIKVRLHGIDAKSVYVDFRGQNMYMGYNRPKLNKVGPGEFSGTWVLASCGLYVEHMEWVTAVLIRTAKKRMVAPFPLETQPIAGESTQ